MQLSWELKEKNNLSSSVGVYICITIGVITLGLALVSLKKDMIISLLFLLAALLSGGVAYTVQASLKEKKRQYVQAIKFLFKEGYFIYEHPEYVLVFSPTAIQKVKSTESKKGTAILFDLNPELVEVVGAIEFKGVLLIHMGKEEYANFKTFYSHDEEHK